MLTIAGGGLLASGAWPGRPAVAAGASRSDVAIYVGAPATLDPAREGDAGSAAVTSQLYETLTAFDPGLTIRPALAASWQLLDGGRRVVFHLRDGIAFSDGSPIRAEDVVRSWLRLLDPQAPSPLASLVAEVQGASEYLSGASHDPASVGFRASGNDVEVDLTGPSGEDFVSLAASPSLGVVPPSLGSVDPLSDPSAFVGSGAYRLSQVTPTALVLTANEHYWAGAPAIATVRLVTDIGGKSPVEVFAAGQLDVAPISSFDASWIAYDRVLGPALRTDPTLSTDYYGFDTSRPPFNDVRIRRAFAMAVDWARVVNLVAAGEAAPATSMVPPGIPGRSSGNFLPKYDPATARQLLAEAGYPGGSGFPAVTLTSAGYAYDGAVVAQLHDALGITVRSERMPADQFFTRLSDDPPAFWSLSWVADYPSPNDFLGVLLGSGRTSNYSRWRSPEFDAAIADATAAADQATAGAAYDRAQAIVQRDVPVVPVSYSAGWTLVRGGLLGASQNGLGIIRLAGLAWAPGS